MAQEEAKVRVRLDTRQAKGELRGLTKQAAGAAGGVGAGLRRAAGRGLAAVGLGAGIGAGIAAIRGPTAGGISSIFTQTFGALGHQIAQGVLGERLFKAQGSARALQKTLGVFSRVVGETGDPSAALPFHRHQERIFTKEARGAGAILAHPGFRNAEAQMISGEGSIGSGAKGTASGAAKRAAKEALKRTKENRDGGGGGGGGGGESDTSFVGHLIRALDKLHQHLWGK